MTTVPYLLRIPFQGNRSGTFPLTWGQRWVWDSVASRAPYHADLGGSYTVAVPDGYDVPAVAEVLSAFLRRYETFRSTYSITPDGTPQQVVLSQGHLRVEVRDVVPADAQEAAAAVHHEFNHLPFTLPEPGLRAAVIASDGVVRFVVLSAFHMAMDCHGMVRVMHDVRSLLNGRSDEATDPAPDSMIHPVDRALEEQGDSGVQRSARGVRFWEKELAKFPDDPLPYTGRRPENLRYRAFEMHSSALRVASVQVARELGVTTSSVVLAMAASVLTRRTRSRTCGVVLAASHRYDPDAMRYAGTLVQGVPAALDVSDTSPRTLISRCHRAGMLAALAGHCDPDDTARMIRDTYGAEAAKAKLACVMNLNLPAAGNATEAVGARVTAAEAEALLAESRYEYTEGTPVENERFYLSAQGDASDFFITLRADTAALTSIEIVQFLRDLERSVLDCLA